MELDPDDDALSRSESTLARYEIQLLDRAKKLEQILQNHRSMEKQKNVQIIHSIESH